MAHIQDKQTCCHSAYFRNLESIKRSEYNSNTHQMAYQSQNLWVLKGSLGVKGMMNDQA